MKTPAALLATLLAAAAPALPASAQTALTIYNQNFAVVRETVPLDLTEGVNTVSFDRATRLVEPDSVVLRDPSGKVALSILEQSYRAETASQGLMLSLFEGRELDFIARGPDGAERLVRGRVIRSGHVPNGGGNGSPIVEVDGNLRFSLPGEPVFPALADGTVLRPTLTWRLHSDHAAKVDAQLGYISGGLAWNAAYNLVSPEKGDTVDIVGWVTLINHSGSTFTDATVKLMAGDVNKIAQQGNAGLASSMALKAPARESSLTEKSFDEFHLYGLPRPVTLRSLETKQVELLRATGVRAKTIYIYNGAAIDARQFAAGNDPDFRHNRDYGTASNAKVWVYREFKNTQANGLGLPLPRGRVRFYRVDDADGALEFTGENFLDHTPQGETVSLYTGDAFDLVGERKRTDYAVDTANNRANSLEEAFEIRLRNRKKDAVEVRVTEWLYRWANWRIIENSEPYAKTDDRNIEFRVTLAPDEEKVVTYRVRYDWK